MFYNKKLKSDYISFFNKTDKQTLPSGYPCTFDTDCTSPAVCQFNVCTINIGGNETSDLANICRGLSVKDCAKEMQKERERTEVPIYVPNYPTPTTISGTGGTGTSGGSNIPINTPTLCKYDKECTRSEICISGICVDKSNFPLIARQRRLKSSISPSNIPSVDNEMNKQNLYTLNQSIGKSQIKNNDFNVNKFFEHKKTPLDGTLSPYEYMFLLESGYPSEKESMINGLHDDYFYFNNKL